MGNFPHTVSEVLKTALCTVQNWREKINLSVNPNKRVIIPFTRKREIKGLKEPILFNKIIHLSSELEYLRMTLDEGLTWKQKQDKAINKDYKAFWTCRGTFVKLGD
jgi:hypothetical protein